MNSSIIPLSIAKAVLVNEKGSFVEADYRDLDVVTKETLNFTGEKDVIIVYSKHNPSRLDYPEGSVEAMNFAPNL